MTRQIERLVESSYSDLAPSLHIEAELLAHLPPQRARPKRSVPIGIAAVILIGITVALFGRGRNIHAEAEGDPGLALATVTRPDTGVVASAKDDIPVRLRFEGRIEVRKDDKWMQASLDGLGEHLRQANRDQRVVVFADRNAPWQHVQWIAIVCAELSMRKLAFAVLAKSNDEAIEASGQTGDVYHLDASLPTDADLNENPGGKRIRVWARPRGELQRAWDGADVAIPTRADYWIDDEKIEELARVAPQLAAARKRTPNLRGEIKAIGHTPFWVVAELVAEYRRAEFEKLDFYGATVPSKEIRAAPALPCPTRKPTRMGPTLRFDMVNGDPKSLSQAAVLLRRRARAAGYGRFGIVATGTGIEWTLQAGEDPKLATQLAERKEVSLEFHITVERDEPDYAREWKLRQKGEKPGKGFQWYELSESARKTYAKKRLPAAGQPLVLCRTDDYGITKASLRDVNAAHLPLFPDDTSWAVTFNIQREHQRNMAALTGTPMTFLAIVLDGKIHSAPFLTYEIRTSAQIRGNFSEPEAKTLAALLASPPLPVQLKLNKR